MKALEPRVFKNTLQSRPVRNRSTSNDIMFQLTDSKQHVQENNYLGRLPLLKGTPEVSPSRRTKVHNIPRLKLNSMQSLPRVPKLAMEMTKQQYFDASNFVDNFENDTKDIKDKAAFEING